MEMNQYVVRCALEALHFAYGAVTQPDSPVKAYYTEMWGNELELHRVQVPKLMFTVFNGGKALNSKVKFSRFYIIIDIQGDEEDVDATELYFKISGAVKKGVQTHKLGENGFKPNASGAYFNAHDSHNETFKLLEDAIASLNVNTAERKYISIGINVDSESYYLADQSKYDIDGPKNLYDSNMLSDWIVKLSTDHPLLTYVEDPFVQGEIAGY